MSMASVVVAMSGGVDSSVAAALLKQSGYQVVGMMLRLWSEPGNEAANRCCTPDSMALARRVAAKLDIPFYAVDAQDEFYEQVVRYFVDGYAHGVTPNPCLACNRHIRWGILYNRARTFGADYFATGHYARSVFNPQQGWQLLPGLDPVKDQSYVLHVLTQTQLAHTKFPVGDYTKSQIRRIAGEFELPVAARTDSQDLCFLGTGDYRPFLQQYAPYTQQPGPIKDQHGNILGKHNGLANYTIGQRKKLGIYGPKPYYVLAKDLHQNTLVVGYRQELGGDHLLTHPANWISGRPPERKFEAEVKIRSQASAVSALVTVLPDDGLEITFRQILRDITPGQAAVIYQDEICLGGAVIASAVQ